MHALENNEERFLGATGGARDQRGHLSPRAIMRWRFRQLPIKTVWDGRQLSIRNLAVYAKRTGLLPTDKTAQQTMDYNDVVKTVADILKDFDAEMPAHKAFRPGIGPFGEPQLVRIIAQRLSAKGMRAETRRTPDLDIEHQWAIEFKIVRPFGDNGKEAEDWSVNMLHPYGGNVSLLGDAVKLAAVAGYDQKGLFVVGFEHGPPRISLDPLLDSFELIARQVMRIRLGERIEERRGGLVHPEHQVVRCVGWELKA